MVSINNSNIRIRILEDIPYLCKTHLAQDVSAGLQTIQVFNLIELTDQTFYAYLGNQNGDNQEVVSFSGNLATSSVFSATLRYDHNKYEEIRISSVYKVALYESSTEDGTYTLIDSEEITLQDPNGVSFFDVDFDSEKFYKINYIEKDSLDADQEIWDINTVKSFQIEGGDKKNVYATIQEVIDESGQQYENYKSKTVWGYINSAKNRIDSVLFGVGVVVPMLNPPEQIKYLTRLLASVYLLRANGNFDLANEKERYVENMLMSIKKGEIEIIGATGSSSISYNFPDYEDRLARFDKQW